LVEEERESIMFVRCLTVEEVGGHQQFQSDFGSNGKLGNFGRAVGVTHLVSEVHAHLLQNMRPTKENK